MNRQRANDLDAQVRRLRLDGGLSDATAAKAREVASLWLEEDCRDGMLRGAPAEAERALRLEYRETGFHRRPLFRWNGENYEQIYEEARG